MSMSQWMALLGTESVAKTQSTNLVPLQLSKDLIKAPMTILRTISQEGLSRASKWIWAKTRMTRCRWMKTTTSFSLSLCSRTNNSINNKQLCISSKHLCDLMVRLPSKLQCTRSIKWRPNTTTPLKQQRWQPSSNELRQSGTNFSAKKTSSASSNKAKRTQQATPTSENLSSRQLQEIDHLKKVRQMNAGDLHTDRGRYLELWTINE